MTTAKLLWEREYSNARYQPFPAKVDPVRFAAFRVLQAIQQRRVMSIPAILSVQYRAPAAASALPWYLAGGAPAPIAVWEPKGKANLAASYVRIAGSAGNANLDPAVVGGVAPDFNTETGWYAGNFGSGLRYLKTGIIPKGDQSQAIVVRCAPNGQVFSCPIGASGAGGALLIRSSWFGSGVEYNNGGYLQNNSPDINADTVLAVAGNRGYRNGVAEGATISNWSAPISNELYIGLENDGTARALSGIYVLAVAIWDTSTNHATWMPAVMAAVALI